MHPAQMSPLASTRSPGRMTAVMRALAARPAGKKALRVGVVREGRVVDERLVKDGAITIGEAEDATLVVAGVPRAHRLFFGQDGRFAMYPLAGMRGRVALESGPQDAAQIRARVALGEGARGRLTIGETTILFQLVDAPIAPSRPMLPLAVKVGLLDAIDWRLTIIAALSFLVHFGFVGSLYSDWTDPILSDSFTVQGLVELNHVLPAPVVEDPSPTPSPTPTMSPTSTPAPGPSPRPGPHDSSTTRPTHDPTAGLVAAAEQMRIGLLATTAPGSALDEALRRSNIPPVSLDHADGAVTTDRELTLHASGPIDPSQRHGDLATVVGNTKKDGDDHVAVHDTPGPVFTVDLHTIPGVVPVPNAERTVAAMRPGFRRCYELGLQKDPSMAGALTVRTRIRATGEVDSATITSRDGLSAEVGACIVRKVEAAQFDPPTGGASTLDIPVRFVRQR